MDIKSHNDFPLMASNQFENLEDTLRTLGRRADLSFSKKQIIRDRIFQSVGQMELADAIVEGEAKSSLAVSLKHLRRVLIPQKLSFSMPVTIAVVIFVFLGSVVTGAIAQSSGPAGTLFPVKKVLEQIEMAFISNPISRAKATFNIAGDRLRHLEASLGEEATLEKVLKESQVALVSAREALQVAQAGGEEDPSISELIEQFSALLGDQKTILENIEKNIGDENIKNAVVAVREAFEEADTAGESVNQVSTTTEPIVSDVEGDSDVTGLLEGRQTITGRIGTAYGQPAIFVSDSQYYKVISSPIDLGLYIGQSGVMVTGDIADDEIIIYRIAINSVTWGGTSPDIAN